MILPRGGAAVMQRRHEPPDSLDYFPTPPWATRALCLHVLPRLHAHATLFDGTVLEPACGEGHMAVPLAEFFASVTASDVFDHGHGAVADFLDQRAWPEGSHDWVITNPPFNAAEAFVTQGLRVARVGVALLVRSAFLEGQTRHATLFRHRPPQIVAQFAARVPMHRGRWLPKGKTATAYCWLGWLKRPPPDRRDTRFIWIPPCRHALTAQGDAARFGAAASLPLMEETGDD